MAAIVLLTNLFPTVALCTADNEVHKWLVEVTEVSNLCWPVVHLNIDICVNIRVPWRIGTLVVPDTLEVVRSSNRLAVRTDSEVTSIVEVELFKEQMVVSSAVCRAIVREVVVNQSLCINCRSRKAKVECHALCNCCKIGNVILLNSRKAFGNCSLNLTFYALVNIGRCLGGKVIVENFHIAVEVCSTLEVEGNLCCILHKDTLA